MNRLIQIIGPAPSELEPQIWLERLRDIHRAIRFPEPKLPKLREVKPKMDKVLRNMLKDLGMKPEDINLDELRRTKND